MQKYIKITQSELFVTLFNKREKSFRTIVTKGCLPSQRNVFSTDPTLRSRSTNFVHLHENI